MPAQNPFMKTFDPDSHTGPLPSPCISICAMNPVTGLCEGCYRTIDEIMEWGTASDETKRSIWRDIKRRQHDN
jgi:predicted Fe-S protein YdhL (DUF1289 family)